TSQTVEAWHERNGARSKMNSLFTRPSCASCAPEAGAQGHHTLKTKIAQAAPKTTEQAPESRACPTTSDFGTFVVNFEGRSLFILASLRPEDDRALSAIPLKLERPVDSFGFPISFDFHQ